MSSAIHFKTARWVSLAFLNLFVVALLGVVMRYKIAFSLPWLDQKHMQHAHSHFAFAGWVSMVLMAAMVNCIGRGLSARRLKYYNRIMLVHCLSAYGMLVGFAWQGYGWFSITWSSISLLNSIIFCLLFYADLRKQGSRGLQQWLGAAMFFQVISYLGTGLLLYMMITKNLEQTRYLASVYWYLHFQYNGWFFFACMGILQHQWRLYTHVGWPSVIFHLFFWACIPAYGLSVLWTKLPAILYAPVLWAAIAQVIAYYRLLSLLTKCRKTEIKVRVPGITSQLMIFAAVALAIKLLLQLASVVPWVSQWAFGFRTVVIAYLHLVLLAIITVFLVSYAQTKGWLKPYGLGAVAAGLLALSIFLNELMLAIQGIASLSYTLIPHADLILFFIAVVLAFSVFLLLPNLRHSQFDGYD